jgi:hypothetical protein
MTVATMRRAKSGGHKGAVKQVMNSHVDIEVMLSFYSFSAALSIKLISNACDIRLQIEAGEELTEEALIAKLRACGGAHQPTSYEFCNYSGASTGGSASPVPGARATSPLPTPAPVAAPVAVHVPAPIAAPVATPTPVPERESEPEPTPVTVAEEVQEVTTPQADSGADESEAAAAAAGLEDETAALTVEDEEAV